MSPSIIPKNIGKNIPMNGVGSHDVYLGNGRSFVKISKGLK